MADIGDEYYPLVEIAPDPIFLISAATGEIGETNEQASDLLGYDVSELEGKPVADIHLSDHDDRYQQLLEQTIEQGSIRTRTFDDGDQIYLETRDGDHIPIELHARVIEIDGEPWVYSITRDISQRHEREAELQRQRDRLEKFAEIVSHDLRNPLNVAQGRLELVREECEHEGLDAIETSLDRMEALIEGTLELARQGRTISGTEPVDLKSMLMECWRGVETSKAEFDIEISDETVIQGDPNRVRQLVENLIRNAIEHSDGTVRIRAGRLDSGFFVEDDGPGISQEDRSEVFEIGYSTTKSGSGFGLSIVKEIVEAHGWDIAVTGGRDGGARFEITGIQFVSE